MQFPRKPFLDRVIVEVTPIQDVFQQSPWKFRSMTPESSTVQTEAP